MSTTEVQRQASAGPVRPRPSARPLGRPAVLGARQAISSTHYLATEAGMRMFRKGGNAVDAGVAAGIALGVVERDLVDFAGVAPIMVFTPGMSQPVTIDGVGRWPAGLELDEFLRMYGGEMPAGVARSVTPAAPDSWLTALAAYGTMTLADVLEPSIELAEGFAVFPRLAQSIEGEAKRLRSWPTSAALFLPDGRPPRVGETFRQPDLSRLLQELSAVELRSRGAGREAAILAARDHFYLGEPARLIAGFMRSVGGHLTEHDLAESRVEVSRPVSSGYREMEVHACGPWSQGPMLPLTLNIMESLDLSSSDPDDPALLHYCIEALKLAFADREAFFGDPAVISVPIEELLDKRYASERFSLIQDTASAALPPPGDPWRRAPLGGPSTTGRRAVGVRAPDTAYVAAVGADGTAFSATPSDSGLSGPVVEGMGVVVSTRGSQLHLTAGHPSAIAPGKRPRLTPNPAMMTKGGRVELAFGCPGGDSQPQAMSQVAMWLVDFGMTTQQAIERPRAITLSAPDSFHPHTAEPGVVLVEDLIGEDVVEDLRRRGHVVRILPGYSRWMGAVSAVRRTGDVLEAGADPRRDGMAAAW